MTNDLAGQTPSPPRPPAGDPATPHVGSHPSERGGEHGVRGRAGEHGNPSGTTRPPEATRYLETTRGILSYQELAPLLAERVGDLEARIVANEFALRPIDDELVREFHRSICGDLVPDWAGTWRKVDVIVGAHRPPPSRELPMLMRNYGADLAARWADTNSQDDERLLDMLAFAEGCLLSIHPFHDFNGRVTRAFLRELLRRLGIPGLSLAPTEPAIRLGYLAALSAADRRDFRPLIDIWKSRLESSLE